MEFLEQFKYEKNPDGNFYAPDANVLVLICQVLPIPAIIVERLDDVCGGTEEVLGAAVRGKVVKAARILGDLKSLAIVKKDNA